MENDNNSQPENELLVQKGLLNRLTKRSYQVFNIHNSAQEAEAELLQASLMPLVTGPKYVKPKPSNTPKWKNRPKKYHENTANLAEFLQIPELASGAKEARNLVTLLNSYAHEFRFGHKEESGNVLWSTPTLELHLAGNFRYGDENLHDDLKTSNPLLIALGTKALDRKAAGDLGELLVAKLTRFLTMRDNTSKEIISCPNPDFSQENILMSPEEEHIIGSNIFPHLASIGITQTTDSHFGKFFDYHSKRKRTDSKYEGLFHIKHIGESQRDILVLICRTPIPTNSTRFDSKGSIKISAQEQIEINSAI